MKKFPRVVYVMVGNDGTPDELLLAETEIEDFDLKSFPSRVAIYRLDHVVKADVKVETKKVRS